MDGLMMNYQLTLPAILRHAEQLFKTREIVTRLPDKSLHRYTYADFVSRAKKLSLALQKLGVQPGDRVATLCWNHYQHLEAYFGIPAAGAVLHTLNLRLSPDDLTYIVNHAADKVIIADKSLLPLLQKFRDNIQTPHIIIISTDGQPAEGFIDYEEFLAGADDSEFVYPDFEENQAGALCYTSGTTGRPKGVLYSHRALVLHSMVVAMPDVLNVSQRDSLVPVVPMFHANAWGLPYSAVMLGTKIVFPGPYLDAVNILDLFEGEKVTMSGGVPTVWLGILDALTREPNRWKLTPGLKMAVGGSAAPESLIRNLDRFGLKVIHAWGMTEMTPLGTVSSLTSEIMEQPEDVQYEYRAKQGLPVPLVEIRARGDNGLVPWDSKTMGELEVRGPFVAASYYNTNEGAGKFTEDGWFVTGDVVTIEPNGYLKIQDRSKDLIKSGGEWISSVDLENAIMGHPAVAEAAVIAVPDPKWQERPLAVVVLKQGQAATQDDILEYLAPKFAKWSLPDHVEFVEAIPRTATGKFLKMALREKFKTNPAAAAVES